MISDRRRTTEAGRNRISIKINDSWTLVNMSRAPERGGIVLSFQRNGRELVPRTIYRAEVDLLLRVFQRGAVPVTEKHLMAFTVLRKLGLARPVPDDRGRMLLTPAGRQAAMCLKARDHLTSVVFASQKEAKQKRYI